MMQSLTFPFPDSPSEQACWATLVFSPRAWTPLELRVAGLVFCSLHKRLFPYRAQNTAHWGETAVQQGLAMEERGWKSELSQKKLLHGGLLGNISTFPNAGDIIIIIIIIPSWLSRGSVSASYKAVHRLECQLMVLKCQASPHIWFLPPARAEPAPGTGNRSA